MEPVLLGLAPALITGLVVALANLVKAFGVDIQQNQIDAINAAVLPVMLVLVALGGWWGRSKVTPTDNPTLDKGTEVHVVTPEGQPDQQVVV